MAFGAYVQSTSANLGVGPVVTLAYPSNVAVGNLLIVQLRVFDPGVTPVVTDTRLNTYPSLSRLDTSFACWMFYALSNASSGANTVTVTSDATSQCRVIIAEYEGGPGTVLDASSTGSGDSTALNSGNFVTTVATTVIIGCGFGFGLEAFTPGTGFTERAESGPRMALEDKIVTSATTWNATMTLDSSNVWGMIGAAFRASVAAATSLPFPMSIMGQLLVR